VHDALGEVDVRPTQRAQLAHAQAGERRDDEERAEELGAVGSRDRVDLLGRQHVELAGATDGHALGVGGGVRGDPALALCAFQDAVQKDEDLLDRPPRQLALDEQALAVGVDARRVDRVQQRVGAELRQEVAPHRVAVVADGRRPAVLLVGDVGEPRLACLTERVVVGTLAPRVGGLPHGGPEQLLERRLRSAGVR